MSEDPTQNLGFIIHDVARLLRWNYDRRAKKAGLTRAQWSVMANLRRQDGIRQSTLADILDVKPITLTRQLDRLEKAGWIERREDQTDRRANHVHLTRRATPVLEQLKQLGQMTRKEAFAGISPEELEMFSALLLRIRGNLCDKKSSPCLSSSGPETPAAKSAPKNR